MNNQHTSDGINVDDGGTADGLGYYYYTGNANRIETEEYTTGTFIMNNNSETTANVQTPITMKQTYYGAYTASSYITNAYYNLIFKQSTDISKNKSTYWVASRSVYLYPTHCWFRVVRVNSEVLGGVGLYSSYTGEVSIQHNVMPMVTLKSNIQITGQDSNNVWQLDVE